MKKFKKLIIISICFTMIVPCLVSCTSAALNKVKKVKSEVDYGYTTIGSSIIIDGNVYSCVDMIRDCVKTKKKVVFQKDAYPNIFAMNLIGDYEYILYRYAYHSKRAKDSDGQEFSYDAHDVGLFRIDVEALTCEWIYDFEEVYPIRMYDPYPNDMGRFLDDNRMAIQYNGSIQILDYQQGTITDSIEVYDKEIFISKPYGSYHLDSYYGMSDLKGDKLLYYEIDGYSFKTHEYEVNPDSKYAARVGTYVYTYDSSVSEEKYNCYDLTNDESVDLKTLNKALHPAPQEKPEPDEENNAYFINEKKYYLTLSEGSLEVLDANKELLVVIDDAYMQGNSQPFRDLYYMFSKNTEKYRCTEFAILENKLFLTFSAYFGFWGQTPSYIYEYDIENNRVLYVGLGGLSNLRLHEKSV